MKTYTLFLLVLSSTKSMIMGHLNDKENIIKSQSHPKTSKLRASVPILCYIIIVIALKLLGHWQFSPEPILIEKTNNLKVKKDNLVQYYRTKKDNHTQETDASPNKASHQALNTPTKTPKIRTKTLKKDIPLKKPNKKMLVNTIPSPPLVNINKSDSLQLIAVKGIGGIYSRRIIKYRTLLGGYIDMKQLREIYGMTKENYTKITSQVYINADDLPLKIPLKTCTFKTLLAHPYSDYKMTKLLFTYRDGIQKQDPTLKMHSKDLRKIKGIDTVFIDKLIPYLDLNH